MPLARTPGERFDDLVLDSVEDLEAHWATELDDVDFAVEEVPAPPPGDADFDPEMVADHGVLLGRLYRTGLDAAGKPLIVVYRRPVEARAPDRESQGELVFTVVAELAAELLGKDLDDLDL